jgi:hypothetical protein
MVTLNAQPRGEAKRKERLAKRKGRLLEVGMGVCEMLPSARDHEPAVGTRSRGTRRRAACTAEAERHDGHTERKRAKSACPVIRSATLPTKSNGRSDQLTVLVGAILG